MTGDCLCLNLGIECWCTRPGPGGSGYAPHGTAAAARRHYRREGPGWQCDPCRQAERQFQKDRRLPARTPPPLRPADPALPEGARRVLEMRRWAGMTQRALAAGLGLERSAVSRWESGRCEAGPVVLGRVAAVTGFPAGGAAGWEAAA